MARESSRDLFLIIKSLSKSEKRYFKIFASRHVIGQENKYVRLFEKMEGLDDLDDQKLLSSLGLTEKQLADHKNYLKELVLESLRWYESQKSVSAILRVDIKNVEILFKKALYDPAKKILVKAKLLAEKHEKFTELLDIIDWQKNLIAATSFMKSGEHEIEDLYKEEQETFEKQKNISDLWLLYSKITQLYTRVGLIRGEADYDHYSEIMNHHLLSDPAKALSFRAKVYYYTIHSLYAFAKGDHLQDYNNNKSLVHLMDLYPDQVKETPKSFLAALNNLVNVCILMKKHEEAYMWLDKMKAMPEDSGDISLRKFTRSTPLELTLHHCTGNFEKATEIIPEIEHKLEYYKERINNYILIQFYYGIAYSYFGAGNYTKALHWLNKILNDTDLDIKQDLYSYAKTLSLVIHYEMKKFDLLPYLLRSFYRFLKNKNKLYKFESLILRFLTRISDSKNRDSLSKSFQKLRREMYPLLEDEYEKRVFEFFDFISWIDSKIENRPFAEVIREKSSPEYQVNASLAASTEE